MRIIAGEFRGRKLLPPQGDSTRPITDRAKQSLFDILSPRIPEATIYDLFAGTGSLGLECLSRAGKSAIFFESDRSALMLLEKNIKSLAVSNRTKIVRGDLFDWFTKSPSPSQKADVIFLDPPYRFLKEQPDCLRSLAAKIVEHHLSPSGLLVFRHDARDTLDLPKLRSSDFRDYASMRIEFLQPM